MSLFEIGSLFFFFQQSNATTANVRMLDSEGAENSFLTAFQASPNRNELIDPDRASDTDKLSKSPFVRRRYRSS